MLPPLRRGRERLRCLRADDLRYASLRPARFMPLLRHDTLRCYVASSRKMIRRFSPIYHVTYADVVTVTPHDSYVDYAITRPRFSLPLPRRLLPLMPIQLRDMPLSPVLLDAALRCCRHMLC